MEIVSIDGTTIVGTLIVGLLSVLSWFMSRTLNRIESKMDNNDASISSIGRLVTAHEERLDTHDKEIDRLRK